MTLAALCAAVVALAALGFSLRELGWRGVPLFGILVSLGVLSYGLDALRTLMPALSVLFTSDTADTLGAAMRILGIGYLSGLTADICRSLGEVGIARAVTLVARLEILLIALPFIEKILDLAFSLVV